MKPRSIVLALLIVVLAPASVAAPVDVAPGIHLLPGHFAPGTQPDGNTVVLHRPEGLIVVDSGRHAAHTQAIVDYAQAAQMPVRAVINTHWHLDHIGGNAALRRSFPQLRVYASDALRGALGGFLAEYRRYLAGELEGKAGDAAGQASLRAEMALIDAGALLAPDEVITHSQTRAIAGRELELHLESGAVTAGDLWLLDPATRVLIAGDLVTLPVPFLDTACPQRWQGALDRLANAEFETLIPGHGSPMQRESFERYRDTFGRLLGCADTDRPKEACIDGWIAGVGPLLAPQDTDFARRLLDYYIDEHLRAPPEHRARHCA